MISFKEYTEAKPMFAVDKPKFKVGDKVTYDKGGKSYSHGIITEIIPKFHEHEYAMKVTKAIGPHAPRTSGIEEVGYAKAFTLGHF